MHSLQRNAVQKRAAPTQAEYRPLEQAAQTVATPPGLHYTSGVVQRMPAIAESPVIQRVTKRTRPASFDADYSEEDEFEAISDFADHERIGLVSWNVQHFSDHDLAKAVKELQQQLNAFDMDEWQTLFEEFNGFRDALGDALNADYEEDAFKQLQGVRGRLGNIAARLLDYDAFLKEFNVDEFAEKIQILQSKAWHDEIAESDNDQARRVALLELVGKFKYVIEWIEGARAGLKNMAAVLSNHTLFQRMDPDLASEAKTLLAKLRKVRGSIVNKSTLETFRKALHSHNIAIHIDEMFAQNDDWLDVIILQEINNPALLDDKHAGYTIHRGAHLKSTGKNGQNEYYPLLIRKGSGVTVEQEYLVTTSGTLKKVTDSEIYNWQKKKSVYRPIMAYLVSKDTASGTQQYLIGVVHTTPEVDGGFAEFNRRAIYDEVAEGLAVLKKWAKVRGLPLIVGGDYYLSAEAVVNDPSVHDLALYGPGLEEEEEDADLADDRADIEKIRQSIAQVIDGLKSIEGATEEEAVVIKQRLKVLTAAKGNAQILRNICNLTVQAKIEQLGLYLDQTISGTNPKANPLTRWFDLQIADFFIHNDVITESRVGIVRPEGDIVPLDQEDLEYSRYWQNFSDHFPVGGIYGVGERGIPFELGRRGQYPQDTTEQARLSNLQRFAYRALADQGQQARFDELSEEAIERLALHELHVQIQMIDPSIVLPSDVEECLALIEQLEYQYSSLIAEEDRLFVTKPTDFEPDYRGGRSPPAKRPRLDKDDTGASSEKPSSRQASGSRGDTAWRQRGGTTGRPSLDKGKGAAPHAPQVQPSADANRVSQEELHAYLGEIAPGWDQPFQNVPGNGAQQGLNQGYLAHQVAHGQGNVALPIHIDADVEEERIADHQLRVLRNAGQGAYCFIYSILMGLTGQSEQEVFDMVAYIARRAGATRGWINADSQVAANVVQEIDAIYGVQLDVVVVQHGADGAIVSGRAGQLGGHTVLIRQTPGHYDAYVP